MTLGMMSKRYETRSIKLIVFFPLIMIVDLNEGVDYRYFPIWLFGLLTGFHKCISAF